ncbi:hypothetical protein [Xanthocytophaga agilis]|uniref:Uncharacterized protein n=1 Tax=Xanthocytophaga agilis TaxID=3048010 RepID=A0AAE3RD97_9BACT|nr:hypothetical protein [Xanthocytophaga agilis]MDJ1506502.1 hypothetical protein [Xanthocytophaga agilis]
MVYTLVVYYKSWNVQLLDEYGMTITVLTKEKAPNQTAFWSFLFPSMYYQTAFLEKNLTIQKEEGQTCVLYDEHPVGYISFPTLSLSGYICTIYLEDQEYRLIRKIFSTEEFRIVKHKSDLVITFTHIQFQEDTSVLSGLFNFSDTFNLALGVYDPSLSQERILQLTLLAGYCIKSVYSST